MNDHPPRCSCHNCLFGYDPKPFTPQGTRFYSQNLHRFCILVKKGPFKGWVCYRIADGTWVTLRKATKADKHDIEAALNQQIEGK